MRIRRWIAAAGLLGTVALGSMTGGAQPALAAAAVPQALDASQFRLTQDYTGLEPAADALDTVLAGQKRTVAQVMDAANRTRQPLCNSSAYSALSSRSAPIGFCWGGTTDTSDGDDTTTEWYPQGLTTTRDATGDQYDGHQLMAVSWYFRGVGGVEGQGPLKGVRLSLVDWDADYANTYRHLELVEPYLRADGTPDYKPLLSGSGSSLRSVHAGGIAWYGNLLYVADTWYGLRVFDMSRIYEVSTADSSLWGRQSDGSYDAYGYRYVIPQVAAVRPEQLTVTSIRFSTVSVDRTSTTSPSLLVGESADDATEAQTRARVIRFPLDPASGRLVDSSGTVTATEAYHTGLVMMQGTTARDGRFWFATAASGSNPGRLYYWVRGTATVHDYAWAVGPESLSYWPDPDKPDYLWTLTERAGNRVVVGVPQADWN